MENPQFIFSSGPFELKEEGKDFFVEGYISNSDLDLVNDVVTKGCLLDMAEQMKDRVIKFDVEHESFRGNSDLDREMNKTLIPVAKVDDFSVDKKGLKVRAMLNRHAARFDEVKGSIEDGFLDAFSIAYIPTQTKSEIRDGKEIRLLDKINLLNVAFTGNPVNTTATMTNVFAKSLEFLKDQENNIHESDTNNQKEVKKMSEEDKKTEESTESESKEDVVDKKDEESSESEDSKEESKEEKEEVEEKSKLKAQIQKLEEEMVEVKALLNKPNLKSKVDQEDKSGNFVEEKELNPLDVIA